MSKSKSNTSVTVPDNYEPQLGDKMSFAAAEAYKLLRTNLMFSLPDVEKKCKTIGITSAIRGEGKSTTAVNLAYSLAEAGKRVLLVDADMRLPSVSKMLKLHQRPGLSNLLSGQTENLIPIQKTDLHASLHVISSGDIPPNPSELLGAKMMEGFVQKAQTEYDYIIIDLPPVTVVSDALVITPVCDGVLMVVRQDYTRKREVSEAIRLLEYCNAKIVGYVMNDADAKGRYYRSGLKNRYYKSYYKKNEYIRYGYENAGKTGEAVKAADKGAS